MSDLAAITASFLSVEEYFALVEQGDLRQADRVELLEGLIVAMPPQNPEHASSTSCADRALRAAVADRAAIRVQLPLALARSAPEPDIAVVAGHERDYRRSHPASALLVVEVADSSLIEDRLTKSGIYAAAGIPEYWIVNLRDRVVEVLREPDRATASYARRRVANLGETLELATLPGASVRVDDLLPS